MIKDKDIYLLMQDLGIPANLKGYEYLRHAIKFVYEDPSYIHAMTKRLYPDIANHLDTTAKRVERAIRHAVDYIVTKGDMDILEHYFGNIPSNKRGCYSNSVVIATLAEYLRYNEED